MAQILFFGRLSDAAVSREITLPPGIDDTAKLADWLCQDDPALASAFERTEVRVIVNEKMTLGISAITDADTVAFASPVSGG